MTSAAPVATTTEVSSTAEGVPAPSAEVPTTKGVTSTTECMATAAEGATAAPKCMPAATKGAGREASGRTTAESATEHGAARGLTIAAAEGLRWCAIRLPKSAVIAAAVHLRKMTIAAHL